MTAESFHHVALPSLVAEYAISPVEERLPSTALSALWGVELPQALAQIVDALGNVPPKVEVVRGSFNAFAAPDWLPSAPDAAFTFMLGEWFRRLALMTRTIPLGNNGGGDIWLAEVHPDRSRVFLLDHDETRIEVIADSMPAFAHVVHLENETRKRVVEAHEWIALEGRVRGGREIELPKGFRELEIERGRDLADRVDAVDELLGCLWYGHEPRASSAAAQKAAESADVSADAAIEHLLRAFLRGEDDMLARLLEPARSHAAGAVRAAALFAAAHRGEERATRHRLLVPRV